MATVSGFPAPFGLGPWLVQAELNRITGPGGAHQIEPRIMRVLLVLAARAGGVVTRQDLLDEVWAETIVGEEILTRAVSELRRVFGDDARQPAYIETIRQHGYRLIMPVGPAPAVESSDVTAESTSPVPSMPDAGVTAAASQAVDPLPGPALPEARRLAGTLVGRALPLLLVAAVAILAVTLPRWWRGEAPPPPAAPQPLTTYPGRELHPALSPDGARVAFAWSGPDGRAPGIYVKQRNSETALRLTDEPGWSAWPAWLPGGQTVAFVQSVDTISAICLVPSLGGPVRRLCEVESLVEGLDAAPDGEHLAWASREPGGGPFRVRGLSLADPATAWLPVPATGPGGDVQPRFAPDGRWLAWVALGPGGDGTLTCAPVAGGKPHVVARARGAVGGLAWTPDSRRLIYAAAPAGAYGLWQVARETGHPEPVPLTAEFAWNPTVAPATGDLAFEQVRMDHDIWRLQTVAHDPWRFETSPFLVSTRWESDADLDPAAGRVAFVSSRSGSPQIWLCGAEGDDPTQLTDLDAAAVSRPCWAPDGSRVAFRAVTARAATVMVVAAAGGRPRPVPLEADDVLLAGWSADGRTLLVSADLGDGWQVHRVDPLDGNRQTLTRGGGLTAAESPDGHQLFHTRPGLAGLWVQDLTDSSPPVVEIPGLLAGDRGAWRLTASGIHWVMRVRGRAILMRYDLDSRQSLPLAELPGLVAGTLAVSAGSETVLFTRVGEIAGDLMELKGFAALE